MPFSRTPSLSKTYAGCSCCGHGSMSRTSLQPEPPETHRGPSADLSHVQDEPLYNWKSFRDKTQRYAHSCSSVALDCLRWLGGPNHWLFYRRGAWKSALSEHGIISFTGLESSLQDSPQVPKFALLSSCTRNR